jgi:hypothetical protein
MKRLLTRQSYLNELKLNHYTKYTKINEVFANDLPWGDTHIGRMINSFARKAKISFNKRRISGLSNRLKSIFDEMLEVGSVEITDDSISILFLQISSLLGELVKKVNDGDEVEELIRTTEDLKDHVNRYKYDKKDDMIKALDEFLEYLRSLKSGNVSNDDKSSDESKSNPKKFEEKYLVCKSFLQSVVSLHDAIKMNAVKFKDKEYGQDISRQTHFDQAKFDEIRKKYEKAQSKDKLAILRQLVQMCENGLDAYKSKGDKVKKDQFEKYLKYYSGLLIGMERDQRSKGEETDSKSPEVKKPGESVKQGTSIKTTVKQNSSNNFDIDFDLINEEANPSSGLANLEGGEAHAKNSWKKVINAYNQSKIASFIPQIEELLNTTSKGGKENLLKAKDNIINICKQCVLNISTVGKPIKFEDLIKEDVNINDVSKSISLFGRILLAYKDDIGLTGSYGKAGESMKIFINSFVKLQTILKSTDVPKKESLHRYFDFNIILEKNQYSEQIKEKFNEIFTEEVKAHFEISDSRKVEIEKSIKERPQGELVFTDADPIIEIVRLFNRAWRIHTPGVIPSGRTGGRVSNSVFREYEDLGSGNGTPDSPGSGPYRNIELFDQWNEVVQDVLSDTKYRPIFSEYAVFRFVNEETGQEGDPIERGGKTLLKFVNELLSESKMYKKGAMNNFIEEYFKLSDKQVEKMGGQSFDPSDLTKNSEVVDSIKDTEVIYKKLDSVASLGNDLHKIFTGDKKSEFEGLSFKVKLKVDDKSDTYYFKYISTENNYPILVFSKVNFPYDLTQIKGRDINKANIPINIYLSSLPTTGKFNNGSSIDLKFIEISSDVVKQDQVTNRKKFTVENVEILCTSESGEPFLDLNKFLPKFKKFEKNINTAKSWLKSNA